MGNPILAILIQAWELIQSANASAALPNQPLKRHFMLAALIGDEQ